MRIELSHLESPIGRIQLAVGVEGLCALEFGDDDAAMQARIARRSPAVRFEAGGAAASLALRVVAYFDGELAALDEIPVVTTGTPFQQAVWAALRRIPTGQTTSYGAIARGLGKRAAVRAVGAANGQNPVSLVVPCHRVIASDGTLCGYGGGLWRKEWLLRHERALLT